MKAFDKSEVNKLVDEINLEIKKRKINRNHIKLTLKQNNIVKSIDPKYTESLQGAYNGYGYENLGKHLMSCNFIIVRNKLLKLKTKESRKSNIADTVESWCTRLSKLTNLSLKECKEIADSKLSYKLEKINEVESKQYSLYSIQREKLINKMKRANPLRYIKNAEHAKAIIVAHDRHENTNYDSLLDEAREKALFGEIDRGEVKEYARQRV